jgi:hypothetical protein
MKKITCIFCIVLFGISMSQAALAKKRVVLTAKEVNSFLIDRTMSVTEAERDKTTGKNYTFKAYFNNGGGIRAVHPDGASFNYNWAVTEDGSLCVRNNMRWGGMCGWIVNEDGTHKLYRNRRGTTRADMKGDRAFFSSDWKLFLTFSNMQKGQHL